MNILVGKGNLSGDEMKQLKTTLDNILNQEKSKKEGVLWKPAHAGKGIGIISVETWSQKYFKLAESGLMYFDQQTDSTPKKTYTLQQVLAVIESHKLPNLKGTWSVFEVHLSDDSILYCAASSKKERDEWIYAIEVMINMPIRKVDLRKRYDEISEHFKQVELIDKARQFIIDRNQRHQNKQLSAFDAFTMRMEVTLRKQNPDFGVGQKQILFDWVTGGWENNREKMYSLQGYGMCEAIIDCEPKKGVSELAFKKGDIIELLAWPCTAKKQYDWIGRVNGKEGAFNIAWPKKYIETPPGCWLHLAWTLDNIHQITTDFKAKLNPDHLGFLSSQIQAIMFHYDESLPPNAWRYQISTAVLHCFGHVTDQSAHLNTDTLIDTLEQSGYEYERRLLFLSPWVSGWNSELHRVLGVNTVNFEMQPDTILSAYRLSPVQRSGLLFHLYVNMPRSLIKLFGELQKNKLLLPRLKLLTKIIICFKATGEMRDKKIIWFSADDVMHFSCSVPDNKFMPDLNVKSLAFNPQEGTLIDLTVDYLYLALSSYAYITKDKHLDHKKLEKKMSSNSISLKDRAFCLRNTARELRRDNPVFQTKLYANYVLFNEYSL